MTATDVPRAVPPFWRRKRNVLAIVLYLAVMGAVVAVMFQVRRVTLRTMDTPEARAQWEAWRKSPANERTDLPVRRRPPKSPEPPALVLMRDYFGIMLTAALVFGSLLFAAIAIAARGAFGRQSNGAPRKEADRNGIRD
jgi:hypothetical protein